MIGIVAGAATRVRPLFRGTGHPARRRTRSIDLHHRLRKAQQRAGRHRDSLDAPTILVTTPGMVAPDVIPGDGERAGDLAYSLSLALPIFFSSLP
ncbi:MAG: hypothetical protein M3P14_00445, partial [Chloroflexota bacterium]|nr:hypothetical protein [Chloroflexota bacterium]